MKELAMDLAGIGLTLYLAGSLCVIIPPIANVNTYCTPPYARWTLVFPAYHLSCYLSSPIDSNK